MIRGSIPVWRTLSRRAKWLVVAAVALFLLAPASYHALRYASARARLDAAIAEARANGEPVWFSDLDPGPEKNPSADAKELLALCRQLVMTKEDEHIVFKAESIVRNGNDDGRLQVTEEEYERIDEITSLNENTLNQIFEIAQRGDCWFEYDYEGTYPGNGLDNHSKMLSRAESALNAQMVCALRSNDENLSLATVLGYFRLAEAGRNEPVGVLGSCYYECLLMCFRGNFLISRWSETNQWSDEAIESLESQLAQAEPTQRLAREILNGRASILPMMSNLQDEDVRTGLHIALDLPEISPAWLEEFLPGTAKERRLQSWSTFLYRPWIMDQQRLAIEFTHAQAECADAVGPEATMRMKELDLEIENSAQSMPLFHALQSKYSADRSALLSLRQSLINGAVLLSLARTFQGKAAPSEQLVAEIEAAIDAMPPGYFSGERMRYEIAGSTVTLFDVRPNDNSEFGHFKLRLFKASDKEKSATETEQSSE